MWVVHWDLDLTRPQPSALSKEKPKEKNLAVSELACKAEDWWKENPNRPGELRSNGPVFSPPYQK